MELLLLGFLLYKLFNRNPSSKKKARERRERERRERQRYWEDAHWWSENR